jgi:hypothetical protein
MSYGLMLKAEAELKAQIEALLNKARVAGEAEKNEPELDIPAEIARRQDRLDAHPEQTLADAGYRSEAVFEVLAGRTDLVVAIGREGKSHRPIDEASLPLTAAMVAAMKTQAVGEGLGAVQQLARDHALHHLQHPRRLQLKAISLSWPHSP